MADIIKVGCRVPSGLRLIVHDTFDDPLNPGAKQFREVGLVELRGSGLHRGGPGLTSKADAGYTDVDADLFEAWWSRNDTSDLVASGAVFKAEPGDEPAEPAASPVAANDEPEDAKAHADAARAEAERQAREQDAAAPPSDVSSTATRSRGRRAS